jgi:hypothetical protein
MRNPYYRDGNWYWFDETELESKPYPTQTAALKDLLLHCQMLEVSPTWMQKFIQRAKEFWNDTRG